MGTRKTLYNSDGPFFPLTTAEQVVCGDGERLSAKNLLLMDDQEPSKIPAAVNADTLGGRPANEYALKDDRKWKKLGQYVGGDTVVDVSGITSWADEILLVIIDTSANRRQFSVNVPCAVITDELSIVCTGYAISNTSSFINWNVTKSTIKLRNAQIENTNYYTTATWFLFYR